MLLWGQVPFARRGHSETEGKEARHEGGRTFAALHRRLAVADALARDKIAEVTTAASRGVLTERRRCEWNRRHSINSPTQRPPQHNS
jgi:hypothetical protein